MTSIRELVNNSTEGLFLDGFTVICVTKQAKGQGYVVHLGNGELIQAKGHQKIEELKRFKPVGTHDRIRQYGEHGSTIN